MTTFKAALSICGLSQQEAAAFFNDAGVGPVSLSTVKDMCRGKSPVDIEKWEALADLYARIEAAADHASHLLEPDLMDRRALNGVEADAGEHPLPGGAPKAAGAMAVLTAFRDIKEL